MAQLVKNPPAVWKSWFWSLGWEDPLEKGTTTHSSVLAWRILYSPWGRKESDMTKWLSLSLLNPGDRGKRSNNLGDLLRGFRYLSYLFKEFPWVLSHGLSLSSSQHHLFILSLSLQGADTAHLLLFISFLFWTVWQAFIWKTVLQMKIWKTLV